ncbi:terminase family protein [Bradyrhizobium sp. Ai1a-2]|uniref:terminase large subunit domain-containing protein n=1 Tax=Bradyrhizobium sp. Ai1a-2 TaxID=196490 RepID=UPI00048138B3|nr:terminase family protein [Bradyrhizobium sp. Ai1a-2]
MSSLVRRLTHALDPVLFARACGIDPDAMQQRLLSSTSRKVLLNCCRQWGKSTTAALLSLHEALHNAPATIILISPSQPQSTELFRKVHGFWQQLDGAPRAEQESLTRMSLDNGSRIISLPGSEKSARGYTAHLIVVDEAARVPDELMVAIRPTLATTGGRIIAMSTPKGRRGWFFENWNTGEDWERISVKAAECPRIAPEYLADELRDLGPLRFSEEFECQFIDSDTSAFMSSLIQQALTDEFEPFLHDRR